MISPLQRPLPDKTQHSQQTNIHAPGGIRTHDRSKRAAADLRLRPRGHWDINYCIIIINNYKIDALYNHYIFNKGFLEECDKGENFEVTEAATASCSKRIL